MKHILKNAAPNELETWKKRKRLTKTDLHQKSRLKQEQSEIWEKFKKDKEGNEARLLVRQSLLEEQGFICCYCLRGLTGNVFSVIENSTVIMEHFVSRFENPTLMFEYENLLACCNGGRDWKDTFQEEEPLPVFPKWCENAKDKRALPLNPCQDDCESHFRYSITDITRETLQISVEGTTSEGTETVEILNLNTPFLRNMRGKLVSNLLFNENDNLISIEEAKRLLAFFEDNLLRREQAFFRPFCLVILQLLRKIS